MLSTTHLEIPDLWCSRYHPWDGISCSLFLSFPIKESHATYHTITSYSGPGSQLAISWWETFYPLGGFSHTRRQLTDIMQEFLSRNGETPRTFSRKVVARALYSFQMPIENLVPHLIFLLCESLGCKSGVCWGSVCGCVYFLLKSWLMK